MGDIGHGATYWLNDSGFWSCKCVCGWESPQLWTTRKGEIMLAYQKHVTRHTKKPEGCFMTINEKVEMERLKSIIQKSLDLAVQFGGIDGAHHKTWVIDQVIRILAGGDYERIVAESCAGEDGPNTYEWDEGIAP